MAEKRRLEIKEKSADYTDYHRLNISWTAGRHISLEAGKLY
jgi:hypothetical protein